MLWLGLHIVVKITSINLSQAIFAIDMLTALKSSLKHRRKHSLRWLRLYGDQVLTEKFLKTSLVIGRPMARVS